MVRKTGRRARASRKAGAQAQRPSALPRFVEENIQSPILRQAWALELLLHPAVQSSHYY